MPGRPRFNDQPWFSFGAPHVYQSARLVAKNFSPYTIAKVLEKEV
jgi:hypothetical protein